MAGQTPLLQLVRMNAPFPVATMMSNQAIARVTPQLVNSKASPQSTPPAQAPPLLPTPQDQQVYNAFLRERNYIQALFNNSK